MALAACYYNEHDPFAAAWLRNLIAMDLIAWGDVDERSIEDVRPDDLRGYAQHHFFAGIGVWSAALRAAGWPDDRPVWTGSCPCQPFSAAGKGGGFADERHLWPSWHWLIGQHRPDVVFGEQVASPPGLAWFDLVSADMEDAGYAIGSGDLCAAGVGAPHIRQRLWFVAESSSSRSRRHAGTILGAQSGSSRERIEARYLTDQPVADGPVVDAAGEQAGLPGRARQPGGSGDELADTPDGRREYELGSSGGRASLRGAPACATEWMQQPGSDSAGVGVDWIPCRDGKWRPVESGTFPLAHGAPARVGRLRGYGNAIVLPLAQAFIEAAMTCLP